MKINIIYYIAFFYVICTMLSCKKFLDEKTDKHLVIPDQISQAQALLDNTTLINGNWFSDGNLMDDNYWMLDKTFDTRTVNLRNEYTWDNNATTDDISWSNMYKVILTCNTALDVLDKVKIDNSNVDSYNSTKGMALFLRGMAHFNVLSVFSVQYQIATADHELGVPYKFSSSISEHVYRSSLAQSYSWIISDIKNSAQFLSPTPAVYSARPSKGSAYGALARIYLTMSDYKNAFTYADSALKLNGQLMNFNNFSLTGTAVPFSRYNIEDIFHAVSVASSPLIYPNWNCDSSLYSQYDSNDLRKVLFFRKNTNGINTFSFRGSYDQNTNTGPYGGIATDEMYLIRAECLVRLNNVSAAIIDLNTLLTTRWRSSKFVNYPTNMGQQDALDLILVERRKELVGRNNLRWMDIKRLNLEARYAKTLIRIVKGATFTLPPNDKRFALLIPPTVLSLSGIEQNQR